MYWYIALVFWAATAIHAYNQGAIKLALFTLLTGLVIIFLVYFQGIGIIGQTLLAVLAIISFISEKFLSVKSR